MKFKKGKYQVLPLRRNSTMHQYILETDKLQNSLAEKNFRVLVDTKLNLSPSSKESQPHPALGLEECCQKVDEEGPSSLLSTGEANLDYSNTHNSLAFELCISVVPEQAYPF